ncbi:MAG: hypothetical protein OD814_001397 [Candidatus Alkanophagales archaeon MCA70_species_1]|nr:hypothetical protein [Candidatus Alkanophaga volatiphilum]
MGEEARVAKKGRFHRKLDASIVELGRGELKSRPKRLGVMIFFYGFGGC